MSTDLVVNVCGDGLERSGQGRLSPFWTERLINSLRDESNGRGRGIGILELEGRPLTDPGSLMGRQFGLSKSSYSLSEALRVWVQPQLFPIERGPFLALLTASSPVPQTLNSQLCPERVKLTIWVSVREKSRYNTLELKTNVIWDLNGHVYTWGPEHDLSPCYSMWPTEQQPHLLAAY